MRVTFLPQLSDADLTLEKSGDVLTLNGDRLDFSGLPNGGELPGAAIENEFVQGAIRRTNGEIEITIILPYTNLSPPPSVAFPDILTVVEDGPVTLPNGRFSEEENAD